jgi:hypothetical protein
MSDFDILKFATEEEKTRIDSEGFTNYDVVKHLSCTRNQASKWLSKNIEKGAIEPTGTYILIPDLNGTPRARPTYRFIQKPIIKERKLGKHRARGLCWSNGIIEIDERLRGMERLEILLHEIDHHLHPDKAEEDVATDAETVAKILWAQRVRIVDSD